MSSIVNKFILFMKELLTAYAQGGEIYNCHENGLIWYHEKGHIERFKNQRYRSLYGHMLVYSTPALIISYDYKTLFYIISLIYGLTLMCYEIDAWRYAFRNHTISRSVN